MKREFQVNDVVEVYYGNRLAYDGLIIITEVSTYHIYGWDLRGNYRDFNNCKFYFKLKHSIPDLGMSIRNSKYFRSYCPSCFTPTRVVDPKDRKMCEICNPPHIGCSSPERPQNTYDVDSYGVSLQHDYQGMVGK